MAELFVRHSLNSRFVIKINITIKKTVPVNNKADQIYVLELGTTALDVLGDSIPPVYINEVTEATLEKKIEEAVSLLCSKVDWGDLDEDRYGPYISYISHTGTNIPIKTKIVFILKDDVPSAGIDLTNMKVELDVGDFVFDITDELHIKGDPYEYIVEWIPPNING